MTEQFDPSRCDLCGGLQTKVVATAPTGRVMRSDRTILSGRLCKIACTTCGLVRSGEQAFSSDLNLYYGDTYDPEPADHVFYTAGGSTTRSRVFADWMVGIAGTALWSGARRIAEIGSGAGHLLGEMSRRFPDASFVGVEPGRRARAAAAASGYEVRERIEELPRASCHAIVAIAVLEHVASPMTFLNAVRARLTPGGTLILAQPTQDVVSYDVLFADHLHHFGTSHVEHYARKCGFRQQTSVVGHPLMPNFSLHVWGTGEPLPFTWRGGPAPTRCAKAAAQVLQDMARLDALLGELGRDGRRVAAFGVHEVFALARAYSTLGTFALTCALDDEPERRADIGCPIVRPEAASGLGVTDALLTMNAVHYPTAMARLERLGIRSHPVLTP